MAVGAKGSDGAFRALILLTIAATFGLIVLGGVVRAMGAGDACPDWPRCHGDLIPPLERDVLIEFSHRLVASLVGFLVLGTALAAWRWQRRRVVVVWGSFAAVALVGGQVVLGGMTVLSDLPSSMVMAHLALASAIMAVLVTVAFASLPELPAERRPDAQRATSLRNLAAFAAIATLALMLTGSYVSGSGAGLAFRDWPLFDGSLMPDGGRLAMIHASHRFAAGLVGLLLAFVAVRAWQWGYRPAVSMTTFAFTLYVAQALVGAANIWTLLQPAAIASHLALAVLLWTTLVSTALHLQRALPAPWPVRAVEERAGEPASGAVAAQEAS